ncbi:MAG TPA: outer membrane beta-barrel protein [Azospirillum sp.]
MKHTSLSIFALAVTAAGLAAPAVAQDLQRGETVLERRRPEVEQLGARVGGFNILPRAEVGTTYDSNVFATQNNTEHDFIFVARPQVNVRSDWNNHALNLTAAADVARFREFKRMNYEDYRFNADGRLDVLRNTTLTGAVFHRREHESPGDADVLNSVEKPIIYYATGGEVGVRQTFNRIRARLTGLAHYYDFDDAQLVGGFVERQDDRNRWEYAGTARVGYEFIDGYEAFVQGTLSKTAYRRDTDYSGRDRDSTGKELAVGASADLTGLLRGEAYVGYLSKDFTDPRLKDFSGVGFGGALTWTVTQLTTVQGRVSRQVRETTAFQGVTLASSYTRTLFAVGVDHELLRSLLINGRAQYRQDEYNGIERSDKTYTLGAGATYNVNRNVFLTGGYTYETRQSNAVNDYSDNLVYLRVGAQL